MTPFFVLPHSPLRLLLVPLAMHNEVLKIKQQRERRYSKSSKRERGGTQNPARERECGTQNPATRELIKESIWRKGGGERERKDGNDNNEQKTQGTSIYMCIYRRKRVCMCVCVCVCVFGV